MDTKVLSSGIPYSNLPESYIRPESERPRLKEVVVCEDIPVIDLGLEDRSKVVQKIGLACKNYGFFQRLFTTGGTILDSFATLLTSICLNGLLIRLVSKSLGLEKDYIRKTSGEQGQHMAVNYYPPCPEPELTYGLPAHTDPNTLTILLQDTQVAGLQVLKEGKWIAVNPQPNAFVINIGDQLQALSNGRYKSVWHRAVVNSDKARMSVASFLCPCDDALISASKSLVEDGSDAVYRDFTYPEYYKKFWSRNLDQEHCLELFKN
ncbi:hypothetical protein Tsubulata_015329 [Turnera subulata]|uniref:Fe2OG dioxygenase domain-containing protein n=1 Tax=Turnera subulata TaxID=218843 RepID=A0A9Q0JAR9_9ROSI|nr:hypothetical protein Tsubulata_015329 [Turnera subulata]